MAKTNGLCIIRERSVRAKGGRVGFTKPMQGLVWMEIMVVGGMLCNG